MEEESKLEEEGGESMLYWYQPASKRDRWPIFIDQHLYDNAKLKKKKKVEVLFIGYTSDKNWDWKQKPIPETEECDYGPIPTSKIKTNIAERLNDWYKDPPTTSKNETMFRKNKTEGVVDNGFWPAMKISVEWLRDNDEPTYHMINNDLIEYLKGKYPNISFDREKYRPGRLFFMKDRDDDFSVWPVEIVEQRNANEGTVKLVVKILTDEHNTTEEVHDYELTDEILPNFESWCRQVGILDDEEVIMHDESNGTSSSGSITNAFKDYADDISMCQEAFRSVMEYFKDNSQYDYCNNKFIREMRDFQIDSFTGNTVVANNNSTTITTTTTTTTITNGNNTTNNSNDNNDNNNNNNDTSNNIDVEINNNEGDSNRKKSSKSLKRKRKSNNVENGDKDGGVQSTLDDVNAKQKKKKRKKKKDLDNDVNTTSNEDVDNNNIAEDKNGDTKEKRTKKKKKKEKVKDSKKLKDRNKKEKSGNTHKKKDKSISSDADGSSSSSSTTTTTTTTKKKRKREKEDGTTKKKRKKKKKKKVDLSVDTNIDEININANEELDEDDATPILTGQSTPPPASMPHLAQLPPLSNNETISSPPVNTAATTTTTTTTTTKTKKANSMPLTTIIISSGQNGEPKPKAKHWLDADSDEEETEAEIAKKNSPKKRKKLKKIKLSNSSNNNSSNGSSSNDQAATYMPSKTVNMVLAKKTNINSNKSRIKRGPLKSCLKSKNAAKKSKDIRIQFPADDKKLTKIRIIDNFDDEEGGESSMISAMFRRPKPIDPSTMEFPLNQIIEQYENTLNQEIFHEQDKTIVFNI